MGFSKRRATSTSKITPSNFEESKKQYLLDIFSIVKMEEIPDALVINWDQTSMKIDCPICFVDHGKKRY